MPAFNFRPTLSTYLHQTYLCGIVENPTIPTPMLNWNIQWAFPLQKHSNYRLHFDFYPPLNLQRYGLLGVLKIRDLTKSLPQILSQGSLSETVSQFLHDGWFAFMFVDYFYIHGTSYYQKKHFRHDLLIFDSDPGKREFKGFLYVDDLTMGSATIPLDSLQEAFASPFGRGAESYAYCRNDLLAALQAGTGPHLFSKLDPADIKAQLLAFLSSSDLSQSRINNRVIADICQHDGHIFKSSALGLDVYDQIGEYFDQAAATGEVWDCPRVTRLVLQHKKLMRIRLLRLIQEGIPISEAILAELEAIEQHAHFIHLKAVAAHRRNNFSSLAPVAGDLARLKLLEWDFLVHLLKCF